MECDRNKNCIGKLISISNVGFFILHFCVRVKVSAYQSSTKKNQSCKMSSILRMNTCFPVSGQIKAIQCSVYGMLHHCHGYHLLHCIISEIEERGIFDDMYIQSVLPKMGVAHCLYCNFYVNSCKILCGTVSLDLLLP